MFSTAKRTSVSFAMRQMPSTKSRAYWRCQRKGGWTTTAEAPRRSAALRARWSLVQGSVVHTRCVMSRQGAWTARTGTRWKSESLRRASMSWLTGSVHTMTSTPS
ncbi:hypothetical protein GA0115246_103569 [Streptomyces sp. SolWspMP-sol7th]|nr:hypothetical protein GA0115246_103569 [Streptomyces sp. SolWspMP-sol7th]